MPTGGADSLKGPITTEKAFLVAFEEYADALFRHCLLRVRDRELATDIVQDTFTKTWTYITEGKQVDHIRAFLYRVANNLIVDASRRKRSSSLDIMMDEDGFEVVDEMAKDPADIPDARVAMKLLRALDDIYQEVITLRFIEGLTPKEISRVLEVSENVVSVRLHRGIERLRAIARRPGRPLDS